MFDIKTFNAIDPIGLERFEAANYTINQTEEPAGIILRSQKLHDYAFPSSVLGVARAGAGTNNIPIADCAKAGIVVFNTPGANANAVKELVLTALLLSVRPIIASTQWIQSLSGGDIEEQAEAQKKHYVGHELEGKKLGVIGLGAIGALIANDAYRLGMDVTGYDPFVSVDTAWSISRRVKRATSLDDLLKNCDFITVHVPYNENTHHLIGAKEIAKMKAGSRLFNFARGALVDTDAVLTAITENQLAAYTTDFAEEKLLHNEKILVLPHLGASTVEAEINCAKMAAETLKLFLETGEIKHSVNFPQVEMGFQAPFRFTLIHQNVPNILSRISTGIADLGINIENMVNRSRGDYAYTLVDISETDEVKIAKVADRLAQGKNILRVRTIKNTQEVSY